MTYAKLEPGKPDITLGNGKTDPQEKTSTKRPDSKSEEHSPLAELGLKRPDKAESGNPASPLDEDMKPGG